MHSGQSRGIDDNAKFLVVTPKHIRIANPADPFEAGLDFVFGQTSHPRGVILAADDGFQNGKLVDVLLQDGEFDRFLAGNHRVQELARLGMGETARVLARDALRLGAQSGAPFDLVFLDPPYGKALGEKALAAALAGGWIAPGALVVWEEAAPVLPPPGLTPLDARRYGETVISLFRVSPS